MTTSPDDRAWLYRIVAAAHVDKYQIMGITHWNERHLAEVEHDLRHDLSADKLNVVALPEPDSDSEGGERWVYFLTNSPAIREWSGWNIRYLKTRLTTQEVMFQSAVNGTDGRTTEGKYLRLALANVQSATLALELLLAS